MREHENIVMKALDIAMDAHAGQVDKAGAPYIMHPLHVASKMSSSVEFITALLHDVVEDSSYTIADLQAAGFSNNVIEALSLLTHDKNVPYMDYVRKIKSNPIARAVKLADLEHNSDLKRLKHISEKDIERLNKYKAAIDILKE